MSENGSFADAVTAAKQILRDWFENGKAKFSRGCLANSIGTRHSKFVDAVLSQLLDEQLVERQPNKLVDPSRIYYGQAVATAISMGMLMPDDSRLDPFSDNYRIRSTIVDSIPPGGDAAGGGQGEADGKPAKGKRTRGRRRGSVASDPKQDQRIVDAWAKGFGRFASQEEVATEFGITKADVVAALDRHRKRPPDSEIIGDGKRRQGQ